MRISAKAEYAVRAAVILAASPEGLVKRDAISDGQEIPESFLENILSDLRTAGIVVSQRGRDGGYRLTRPAEEIALAEVIRAVDGPLATVRGLRPESIEYSGVNEPLREVWLALRSRIRSVLEVVTLADIVNGKLPAEVLRDVQKR